MLPDNLSFQSAAPLAVRNLLTLFPVVFQSLGLKTHLRKRDPDLSFGFNGADFAEVRWNNRLGWSCESWTESRRDYCISWWRRWTRASR